MTSRFRCQAGPHLGPINKALLGCRMRSRSIPVMRFIYRVASCMKRQRRRAMRHRCISPSVSWKPLSPICCGSFWKSWRQKTQPYAPASLPGDWAKRKALPPSPRGLRLLWLRYLPKRRWNGLPSPQWIGSRGIGCRFRSEASRIARPAWIQSCACLMPCIIIWCRCPKVAARFAGMGAGKI